jgi:tetratricopeptide (TPR) repeat protein
MAVTQAPKAPAANLLLSQAMLAKGDLAQADKGLTQLLEGPSADQTRVLTLRTLAALRLKQGRFADGEKLATEAVNLQPQSLESLYLLGVANLLQKQPDKAIQSVSAYVQRQPDWAEGQALLGRIALQGGKSAQAQKFYENALKLNPKLTTAMLGIADASIAQKNFALARSTMEQITTSNPDNAPARVKLAQLYEQNSDWAKATTQYEAALKLEPKLALAKNNLAWLYSQHSGNLDLALKLAQEAKEAAPDDPHVSDTLGYILIQKGAYDSAIQHLNLAVSKDPNEPAYRYHIGLAYLKAGQLTQAKTNLQAALRAPNFGQAGEVKKLLAEMNGSAPAGN